jgi:hypothetical protein
VRQPASFFVWYEFLTNCSSLANEEEQIDAIEGSLEMLFRRLHGREQEFVDI